MFTNIYFLSVKHFDEENCNLVLCLEYKGKKDTLQFHAVKGTSFLLSTKYFPHTALRPINVDVRFSAILVTFLSAFRLDRTAAI